jgi:hypothetical protein
MGVQGRELAETCQFQVKVAMSREASCKLSVDSWQSGPLLAYPGLVEGESKIFAAKSMFVPCA